MDSYLNPEMIHDLEISISGLMNNRYAAKTSSEIRRTLDAKRRRGAFIGAFAPYGYRKDPKNENRLLPDDEAAGVVLRIFAWYTGEGMSKRGIAQRLNSLGIPNPTAYKRAAGLRYQNPHAGENDGLWCWCAKTVGDILRGRVYALRRRRNPGPPGGETVYPLSGFVRCAGRGKAMHRHTAKGYAYYHRRTCRDKGGDRCGKHAVRADMLERGTVEVLDRGLLSTLVEILVGNKIRPHRPPGSHRPDRLLLLPLPLQRGAAYQRCHGDLRA